jgi:hypothetical protein
MRIPKRQFINVLMRAFKRFKRGHSRIRVHGIPGDVVIRLGCPRKISIIEFASPSVEYLTINPPDARGNSRDCSRYDSADRIKRQRRFFQRGEFNSIRQPWTEQRTVGKS